jgi:CRP/FNR family transcriptional regulator, cyclic AMP receptor protein
MRKALFLMGVLSDTDVEWLIENGRTEFVPQGTPLINAGHTPESIYIVLDGTLSVTVGGKQIAALPTGEVVGEISFVDSRPPSASVSAAQDSQVLAVDRQALYEKLEEDEGFAARFYRGIAVYLADRLRTTTGRFGYGSAQQDADPHQLDELDDNMMDTMSLAAVRFDKMLKRLRRN